MLNIIWCIIFIISLFSVLLNGNSQAALKTLYSAIESAVKLTATLLGVMAFWSGISRICEKSGIITALSKLLSPILKKLFPESFKDKETGNHIVLNFISNVLGLGNAATPHGIKAIEKMGKGSDFLNDETILFVVINTCSLQIIPTNLSALRINYGSTEPFSVLPHILTVSFFTLAFGISLCFILRKISERKTK